MRTSTILPIVAFLSAVFAAPSQVTKRTEPAEINSDSTYNCSSYSPTTEWRNHMAANWLQLWSGPDYSILNATTSPNITIYQDRFSAGRGNGSVALPASNQTDLVNFIQISRNSWSNYTFKEVYTFGVDNMVVLRWTLYATADGAGQGASRLLPQGTVVTYNGTDIFTLNRCTGLIDEVDSAQDLITFYHKTGVPLGTV